jgi:UDP-N-acetylmuramoylalanine--D-glutamate ligase
VTGLIAVVGAGKSGLAVAEHAASNGTDVAIYDDSDITFLGKTLEERFPGKISWFLGMPGGLEVEDFEKVVVSPGVPLENIPLESFEKRGIEVIGEVEYGFRNIRGTFIGITGTNGKSTVTALTGCILKEGGVKTFTGGNLKEPLTSSIGMGFDMYVVELSSFQLETVRSFRPKVALLLNLGEDHMDRYRDFSEYAGAKGNLFKYQEPTDYAVFNADDELTRSYAEMSNGESLGFSRTKALGRGAWILGDRLTIDTGKGRMDLDISKCPLRGNHNRENIAGASLAAALAGAGEMEIIKGILSFPGLPHRMEFAGSLKGITFLNDSKGTNVHSLCSALRGLVGEVVLIAGGKDKGLSFSPARAVIEEKVHSIVVMGEAAERIISEVGGNVPFIKASSMEEAVRIAYKSSPPGGKVLLSPGCSSFDMFRSFEDRGDEFKKAVIRLQQSEQEN